MRVYLVSLQSVTPYFQSRNYTMDEGEAKRLSKEGPDDWEKRTWMHRTHLNQDGQLIIPASAIQKAIVDGAGYLSEKIPGRGNEKWTKHFASGILIPEDIVLPGRRENVDGLWLHLPADGRRGGGKRVWKRMPFIPAWNADIAIYILDEILTEEIVRRVIEHAGQFIGIGQNRPQQRGTSGRFILTELVESREPLKRVA